jgi:hypothetical protein
MTFQNRLDEFNFHKETMEMLQVEKDPTLVETMESVGFSKALTTFLLNTNSTYFNGVMLRFKLYAKKNMSNKKVKDELKNHMMFYPLVDYLFVEDRSDIQLKSVVKTEVKTEINHVSEIDEKVVESDTEEEQEEQEEVNHFDRFYKEVVVEDNGGMLKSKEVYERFSSWYEENVDSEVPSKDELKDYLTEKLGKGDKKGWKGVSLSA